MVIGRLTNEHLEVVLVIDESNIRYVCCGVFCHVPTLLFALTSLEELEEHKLELLHQEAAKKERKISRCTLCKKQFTSPPQLQVS